MNSQPAISSPDAVPTGGATINPNGAVCYIQAEVTWPIEDPAGGNLLAAFPNILFQDSPPNVAFSNHVWATMVRAQ
jgi:hypothetical protein